MGLKGQQLSLRSSTAPINSIIGSSRLRLKKQRSPHFSMHWARRRLSTRRSTFKNPLLKIIFYRWQKKDELAPHPSDLSSLLLRPVERTSAAQRSVLFAARRYPALGARLCLDRDTAPG